MTDPAAGYAPVAVTERSDVVESVHHGAVVVLDADGSVAWSVGDPQRPIYARSALKPLQAAAMLDAGLTLEDRLLAVVCASHDGRPEHVAAVEAILAGAGLGPADLDNTPAWPLDGAAHDAAVRAGRGPATILQNCSGKHAGMLATAVVNGWPTVGYRAVDHPVQRAITSALARATGGIDHVGVDGCGAPAPTVSLMQLACAVRALAVGGHVVHRAMTAHPELVGGPARDVTRLMRMVPGLLVKDGAEGVQVAALPDGRAVALKIADGAGRARMPVTVAALRSLGVDLPSDAASEPILGHGQPVGRVRALVGAP
ncbi:MAG: asparaginase [Ilumatobacteraceae bacterium]